MNRYAKHEAVICRFIRGEPDAMYDIGVGPKTEWQTLPKKYPDMRVFGCEPHPLQYERLLKAGFPGPLAAVAISEHEGPATLYDVEGDEKCASLLPLARSTRQFPIQVWSLDRFDENMGRPGRILLWMDIEGSELSALRSGPRLLASGRVRWINIEERRDGHCPAPGWCKPGEVDGFLKSHGYVRRLVYNRHPTHQDVIYIHKDERP